MWCRPAACCWHVHLHNGKMLTCMINIIYDDVDRIAALSTTESFLQLTRTKVPLGSLRYRGIPGGPRGPGVIVR